MFYSHEFRLNIMKIESKASKENLNKIENFINLFL